jgi:hypothetical protein
MAIVVPVSDAMATIKFFGEHQDLLNDIEGVWQESAGGRFDSVGRRI